MNSGLFWRSSGLWFAAEGRGGRSGFFGGFLRRNRSLTRWGFHWNGGASLRDLSSIFSPLLSSCFSSDLPSFPALNSDHSLLGFAGLLANECYGDDRSKDDASAHASPAQAGGGRPWQSCRPANTVAARGRREGGRRRWTVAVG